MIPEKKDSAKPSSSVVSFFLSQDFFHSPFKVDLDPVSAPELSIGTAVTVTAAAALSPRNVMGRAGL